MTCPYINPTIQQCTNCPLPDCARDERQDSNEYARAWNKNNPEKRRAIRRRYYQSHIAKEREYNKQYQQFIKGTPEYKAMCHNYYLKIKDTPQYKEYKKKSNKKQWQRIKSDPVLLEKHRERTRKRTAEYLARKKAERVS